ncbi:sensor histidine kinase [Pedobacter metabolipauper]|uniref:Histidine kinase n=1 Tax=Pedobacter metabolipauper TaxID=425513 RepID=A0A4R6SZA8_9SPHI|nr:sensor histidine kinase [Pedobacter metabolipauper]TDQ10034.1 histidine kinase [Pedobacter metabolipauper]
MKLTRTVFIHVICWIVILGYIYGGYLLKNVDFRYIAFGISISLIQVIQFYICFLWVYPNYLKRGKIPQLIGGVLISLLVFIVLRYLIEEVIYLELWGIHNYSKNVSLSYYLIDNVYFGSSFIAISAGVWSVQRNFETERMNRKLKDEVLKAELAFLKSQINPHFLYNTLNYVYSLAMPVSDQLANAILRLSDLMRYTLTDSADGKVSLVKEVEYLKSYIELFKMRFEPNFYVVFTTEGIDDTQKIASLMLIPFVENAFKHGVVNVDSDPVRIEIKVQDKRLKFELSNRISRALKDHSSGIGLVNIQRRLDLIYPGAYELLILNDGNTYKTTLNIDLK